MMSIAISRTRVCRCDAGTHCTAAPACHCVGRAIERSRLTHVRVLGREMAIRRVQVRLVSPFGAKLAGGVASRGRPSLSNDKPAHTVLSLPMPNLLSVTSAHSLSTAKNPGRTALRPATSSRHPRGHLHTATCTSASRSLDCHSRTACPLPLPPCHTLPPAMTGRAWLFRLTACSPECIPLSCVAVLVRFCNAMLSFISHEGVRVQRKGGIPLRLLVRRTRKNSAA